MILSYIEIGGRRYLDMQIAGGTIYRLVATHETYNVAARKRSTTFRFQVGTDNYRVQFQVTHQPQTEEGEE